jgi:hypothetical protein
MISTAVQAVSSTTATNATATPKACLAPKSKRCVAFSPNVHAKRTLHANDYSDEEFHACWYDSNTRAKFRSEVRQTVAMMEAGADLDNDHEYCTRGLEGHTKVGAKLRRKVREKAWFAVYDEQERQDREGVWKDDSLARIYGYCTYSCQTKARVMGVSDSTATLPPATSKSKCGRSSADVRKTRPMMMYPARISRRRTNYSDDY